MDSHQRIMQRYRGRHGRAYHQVKRGIPDAAFEWVARSRAAKLAPFVGAQDTVLEYGVGAGWNLAMLPAGRRLGYDLDAQLAPALERHGITFVEDLDELPAGGIDVVICHHVLEHVPDPLVVLGRIRGLLRPGGRLILVVPYEYGRPGRRFDPNEPNRHVYAWNVQALGNLVTDAGFEIRDCRLARYGYDRFAAVWAVRLKIAAWGFRLIRAAGRCLFPLREIRLVAVRGQEQPAGSLDTS